MLFRRMLGAFAGAALLAACAGLDEIPASIIDDLQQSQEDRAGAAQRLADDLVGAVSGTADRSARLCMIVAGVSEIMTDRVLYYDADYAAQALGNIVALEGAHAAFQSASTIFFETDIQHVKVKIIQILIDAARDRVTNLLGNFGGGVNVLGVLDRAKVAARQAAIAAAFIRDIQNAVAGLNAKTLQAADVEAACADRIARNKARIATILGAPGGLGAVPQ